MITKINIHKFISLLDAVICHLISEKRYLSTYFHVMLLAARSRNILKMLKVLLKEPESLYGYEFNFPEILKMAIIVRNKLLEIENSADNLKYFPFMREHIQLMSIDWKIMVMDLSSLDFQWISAVATDEPGCSNFVKALQMLPE